VALHEALQYGKEAFDSLPPTHPAYAWHYTASKEAANAQEIWERDTAGILEWLSDYRAQVISAAALVHCTVHVRNVALAFKCMSKVHRCLHHAEVCSRFNDVVHHHSVLFM
jgi:hypothetical protein